MKKAWFALICLTMFACALLSFTACESEKPDGEDGHTHSFTLEAATDGYLCSPATCTKAETYYYSCECGAKGTSTFEHGIANGHRVVNDICTVCGKTASLGLEFALKDDGTYKLTGIGTCTDTDIIIPGTYNDKAVTEIDAYALATYGGVIVSISTPPRVPFENITIPDTVTSIGEGAFSGSPRLKEVRIPDSVVSVGNGALAYCEKLIYVRFGSGVESIDRYVIHMSNAVAGLEVSGNHKKYYSKNNCIIEKDSETLVVGCKTSVVPDEVKKIGGTSFWQCSTLTSIRIPEGVTSIDYAAFGGCTALVTVTLPDSVKTIDRWAFWSCISLTSVTVGSGVEEIVTEAFQGCEKLVEVINNSRLTIEKKNPENGFLGFYALNVKKGGVTDIVNRDGYLFYTYENTRYLLGYVGDGTELVLPEDYNGGTYEIYPGAFYGRTDLTGVVLSGGVTAVGGSAFYDCRNLAQVTIGNRVTSIGTTAFCNCMALKTITIPEGVVSIESGAFLNCNRLTSVILPDSVTVIGAGAFQACASLTSVTIGRGVKEIGYEAFAYCEKLVEVINNSTLDIIKGSDDGMYAGYYALNIKKGGTTDIVNRDGYLFYTYENVHYLIGYAGDGTELVLPENYNGQTYEIYQSAFRYQDQIESVTIGSGVTSIGKSAFSDCDALTSVKFSKTDGWKCYENADGENGTVLPAEELSDPSLAAEYLTSSRSYFCWKRG